MVGGVNKVNKVSIFGTGTVIIHPSFLKDFPLTLNGVIFTIVIV